VDLGRGAGLEDEGRMRAWPAENPVVHVPDDLHRRLVDEHGLVSPELPLQVLDVDEHGAVHRDPHLRVPGHGERYLDADLVLLSPRGVEPRARPERAAAEHALPAAHQHGVLQRGPGLGPLVRVLLAVAEEEDHLLVADQRDVVPRGGLRAGARRELGGAEVPEHVDAAAAAAEVQRLAALLAPERPRLELHLVGDVLAVRRVDGDGEGLVDEALGPHGGDQPRRAVDLGQVHRHRGALRRERRRPADGGGVVGGRRAGAAVAVPAVHLVERLQRFRTLVRHRGKSLLATLRVVVNCYFTGQITQSSPGCSTFVSVENAVDDQRLGDFSMAMLVSMGCMCVRAHEVNRRLRNQGNGRTSGIIWR
jgi:hypothetical protein